MVPSKDYSKDKDWQGVAFCVSRPLNEQLIPSVGQTVIPVQLYFRIGILTINGGCSLYVPVQSKFEAALSIVWAI